jgi:hypothetical protein
MQMFLMVVLGVFAFFVFILIVFVGGNWLLSLLRKPKLPSEESVRRYRERLLNPRWEELEERFGQAIPARIKNLYTRTELISRRDIHLRNENGKTYHIAEFLPADVETLSGIWSELKKSNNFPFANDSFGDCYYIPFTGDKSEECPVMYYRHDGSDFELVSRSLDEFLEWHRKTG